MRRVHITGGPGSGKTTLAHQVANALQAPCYELDKIGYEGGAGADRRFADRLADIRRIAAQPAWVTEGIFLGWTGALFEAADTIVWLDLPWRLAWWRIVMRHLKAELRGYNPHTGWLKLYRFLRWCEGYYSSTAAILDVPGDADISENRATTCAYLSRFQDKVVRCQTPAQVQAFSQRVLRHG